MKPSKKEKKEAVKAFMNMNMQHRKLVEHKIGKTGVYRGQHHLLMYISDHEGCSQTEIAQANEVTPATIAVSLKKLEKGGYIKRVIDNQDNRYNKITITQLGKEIVAQSHKIFAKVDEITFRDFDLEELIQFTEYVNRIKENILLAQKTEEIEEKGK